MAEAIFFLRFKQQLRRIWPELVSRVEEQAVRAAGEAGGKTSAEGGFLRAVFDENTIGFRLDMLVLIENLSRMVESAAADLYGYVLLLGKAPPSAPGRLCRHLSAGAFGGGVFMDRETAAEMSPYVTVEEQASAGGYFRLTEIKDFVPGNRAAPLSGETEAWRYDWNEYPAILVCGQMFRGRRDDLYRRLAGFGGDENSIPPLFVRFGGGGLKAITDAWPDWLNYINYEKKEEINAAREFLFRQRLSEEPSPYAARKARRFFERLLDIYGAAVRRAAAKPVIILENINAGEQSAVNIVIEVLEKRQDFLLAGIHFGEPDSAGLQKWRPLFPRLLRTGAEGAKTGKLFDLPLDLWETGYACFQLGRFFPPELIPRLLTEAGKSPAFIERAFSLMYTLRVIDTPLDSRPWHGHFRYRAEAVLEDKKQKITAMVSGILLSWIRRQKINPCLHLLEILGEYGGSGETDDGLILLSLKSETAAENWPVLEKVLDENTPETIAGAERAAILYHITETLLALHRGEERQIRAVFASPPPPCPAHPLLRAQTLLNRSLYYLGIRDDGSAAETAKEAAMLCQENGGPCLSQSYRLLALASFSRRQIGEAVSYLGFALENASKTGDLQDTGMAAYYAASAHLLHGNLSRSRALAGKARRSFIEAGSPEWADRARFLEGRLVFEIGGYVEAAEIFEEIRTNPEGGDLPEKTHTLEAWIYRAETFSGSRNCTEKPPACFDADLFALEALCAADDFTGAAELSGALPPPLAGSVFVCAERPDWRSGFAQCELLCGAWNEIWELTRSACQAFALSHISPDTAREAARTMQRILKSGLSGETDPGGAFRGYAWYKILENSGAGHVDISTAVSAAFKQLQSRAGRIDDPEIRRQYLSRPRWNRALHRAAADFKLI